LQSPLHALLRGIDDDLVPLDRVVGSIGLEGLAVLLRADWLRLVSFERGIGHVLWTEQPDAAIERLRIDVPSRADALVKMTPTGANALRAMDEPPPALAARYGATSARTLEAEVAAVVDLALIPSGLVSAPDPARPGSG
jgi:hypothetical protein